MDFIKGNIWEIKKSGSLKFLGGLLAIFQIVQFYFWYGADNLPLKYAADPIPLCRSIFETCEWLRILPVSALEVLFYMYVSLAAVAALIFLLTNLVTLGYWALAFSWLFGGILYMQDLRLSSNEGFLIFFLTFSFLAIPSKKRYFRWAIVSFIAASGLAKLSPDWLTGSWFVAHMKLPIKLGEWLAAMSLLIEMIAAITLLFRDFRFFITGWLCILGLQAMMICFGEWYMPVLNITLLFYIAFEELELRKAEREYIYQSFIRPEPSLITGGILLTLFWAAQVMPFLGINSNSAAGAGFELLALQPLASHEECQQLTYAVYKDHTEQVHVDSDSSRSPTMKCNVYLRFLDLKSMCRRLKEASEDFVTMSSVLEVTSLRTQEVRRAFEIKDFCREDLNFKKLGSVGWNSTSVN